LSLHFGNPAETGGHSYVSEDIARPLFQIQLIFAPKPTIKTFTLYFYGRFNYDQTDIQADRLPALHCGCPDGMQRKS
jgi:hypothetical protein